MMQKINKYLFPFLLLVFSYTLFSQNNIRNVTKIAPEVLKQPIQRQINPGNIRFIQRGVKVRLEALYDYEISGLVAGKKYYHLLGSVYDDISPYDICLIWGSNVSNGVYRDPSIRFEQSDRWYMVYQGRGVKNFNFNEISNNHLVMYSNDVLAQIRDLVGGDQIKLSGKLVNVNAEIPGQTDTQESRWLTGTSPQMNVGKGSCKIIYVERVEVLKKANVLSRTLFQLSSYGLLLLIILNIISSFSPSFAAPEDEE